jgi:glycolate oxidase
VTGASLSGALPEPVLAELRDHVHGRVVTDRQVSAAYSRDNCALAAAGTPGAVVLADSVDDVRATLRVAARERIPVVPRGAGSGLSGGACAIDGGIVLVTAGMDRILELDERDLVAVVEPGVITATLQGAAREAGLEYTPDPASAAFCTLGGNIATNAGGLCCVKYGVTRESVLALDIVRPDGSLLEVGRRTLKSSAGLDLLSLYVGSEGTLGVITRATLRLRPRRPAPRTLLALFDGIRDAGHAVTRIRSAVLPSLMELMDRTTVRAVEEWRPIGIDRDAEALLIVQSDAGGSVAEDELRLVAGICRSSNAREVMVATDEVETDMLLTARRLAFPALERLGAVLLDDVAVPCSRIADLVDGIDAVARRTGLRIGTFGHAGDGNMHPTIVYDAHDPAALEVVMAAFDDIVALAVGLGGVVTGEHGVGSLKTRHLRGQLSPEAMEVHRLIKSALDPALICNPGRGH